jgi:hypothetical protein
MTTIIIPTVESVSSKPRKDDEKDSTSNDIPQSVLSNTLFP